MKRAKMIKKLIKEKDMSIKGFAKKIDIPYTTLHSMLQRGIGNASVDNVIKICKGLDITVEELNKSVDNEEQEESRDINLSNKEKTLVCKFRKLTDKKQEYILGQVQAALDFDNSDDIKKNIAN